MNLDFSNVLAIEYNGKTVNDIYINDNKVWPVVKPPEYFYVENITDKNETLSVAKTYDDAPTLTIEYSTDNSTWEVLGTTSTTALTRTVAPGEKVYLRCSTNAWGMNFDFNIIQGVSKVGGNIMSLLYGSNFTGQETSFPSGSANNFQRLFYENTRLADASELLLPATTLTGNCYNNMFHDCEALTSAPALPATTLVDNCYEGMFWGCKALTSAPALPATDLADGCYGSMFSECTSLTSAPALPATDLAGGCYNNMFLGCTSLTSTPALPATTLASYCYGSMFYGCTSLNNVTCFATSGIDEWDSTYNWLSDVSSTGTFTKAVGVDWPEGRGGIPSGWTVQEV